MKKALIIIIAMACIALLYIGLDEYKKGKLDGKKAFEYTKIQETISNNEKTSPNAKLILRTYYTKCEHIDEEIKEIPEELVNLSENELNERYKDYIIEKFNSDEIVLKKSIEEFCSNHYILRENEGNVIVNKLDKQGNEKYYLSTDIAVFYLPETDQINLKEGIEIYGKEKLIETLQDFE